MQRFIKIIFVLSCSSVLANNNVFIVHGLNLKPEKMNYINQFFKTNNYNTSQISLKGHRLASNNLQHQKSIKKHDWENDIVKVYTDLNEPQNLIGVGQSLGALSLVSAHLHTKTKFKKLILIAPSIEPKLSVHFIRFLFLFPDSWSLPSFNLKEYRVEDSTSLSAYKELFRMRDNVLNSKINIPCFVIANPLDEVIDFEKTQTWALANNCEFYTFKKIDENTVGHQHLFIDPSTAGKKGIETFNKILRDILRK